MKSALSIILHIVTTVTIDPTISGAVADVLLALPDMVRYAVALIRSRRR